MVEPQFVGPEPVETFRVGVDFSVAARDVLEARQLIGNALAGYQGQEGWVPSEMSPTEDGVLGLIDWEVTPPRPSQAALVQEQYPRLVNDLALVECARLITKRTDRESGLGLSGTMLARLREVAEDVNPLLRVADPDQPHSGRMVFDGDAIDAVQHLAEGVYQAFDYNDREYVLVVAPSELAPSGRVSAAFPKERNDAQVLDAISGALRDYTQDKPLGPLLREVSKNVSRTGRGALPEWMALPGEITNYRVAERLPDRPESRVFLVEIAWDFDEAVEPTILIHQDRRIAEHEAAKLIYAEINDSEAWAGAGEFLDNHPGPGSWRTYDDASQWLKDLQRFSPLPAVTIRARDLATIQTPELTPPQLGQGAQMDLQRQVPVSPDDPIPPSSGEGLATFHVPVSFEVFARSASEARWLVDDALTGDVPPAVPGVVEQRLRILEDGDTWGVLGWQHTPARSVRDEVAELLAGLLEERARDITPDCHAVDQSAGSAGPDRSR